MNTVEMQFMYGRRPGPLTVVALVSLALSVIALIDDPVINRDGMLYITVAREFLNEGFSAAFERFNWPFLPLLLACGSQLTGIDPALVGTAYSVLSVMLLSVLAVRIAGRLQPSWRWLAVLLVVGAPVFNDYRADLLRDTGAWMMALLALDQLLGWLDRARRREAIGFQLAIVGAVLFRPELGVIAVAVAIWLLVHYGPRSGVARAIRLNGGLLITGVAVLIALLFTELQWASRFDQYLSVLNLPAQAAHFEQTARNMVRTSLSHFSTEEAPQILFVGLASVIVTKWLGLLGILAVPGVYSLVQRPGPPRSGLFFSLLAFFIAVLLFFLTREFYLSSRYVAPLALFSLPWVCLGLHALQQRYPGPRMRGVALGLVLLSALSGVISTSPDKGYIRQAGQWMQGQNELPEPIYYADRQITYFATEWYPEQNAYPDAAQVLEAPGSWQTYAMVTGDERGAERVERWARRNDMTLKRSFSDGAGRQVRIYVR